MKIGIVVFEIITTSETNKRRCVIIQYLAPIDVGDGGGVSGTRASPQIRENIFSGNLLCKIGAFC